MQQDKELFKKRVSLASLAMVFGIAAYIQFDNLLYLALGLLCGIGIMKIRNLPIE